MFSKRLKELRESRNMYQKELAYELNVTVQTISGWEIDRTTPDYETLIKIANFFNVSIDFLLGNEENATKLKIKLNEKAVLKKLLVKNNYMKENEELTDKEIERLMDFIKINKDYIKSK